MMRSTSFFLGSALLVGMLILTPAGGGPWPTVAMAETGGEVAEDEPKTENQRAKKYPASGAKQENFPATVEEARGRARWMHETIHGALQVMHRDFFGDDEDLTLPSQSLEDVFKELYSTWGVKVRWLGVNATKDSDHEPQDDFEKAAAKALETGAPEYDAVERGHFRFVGSIRIQNECLKCHVPFRTTLEDRVAGLAIYMPLQKRPAETAAAAEPTKTTAIAESGKPEPAASPRTGE